nr:response regulator [Marinobacter gelidimuriae]
MLPDILICDDSEMARKQMARALPTALRHQVSFCRNGSEALAHIRNSVPDLLFLDLNMPDLDGYVVLEHLRSEQIELLTIVVSGDIQPQAKARVFSLGPWLFLTNRPPRQRLQGFLPNTAFTASQRNHHLRARSLKPTPRATLQAPTLTRNYC